MFNFRAFERHKKQLDKIYTKLNTKSSKEFGITNNSSFKLLEEKLKYGTYLKIFYSKRT